MDFNVNKEFVNMLELIAKSRELRRFAYVVFTMTWLLFLIRTIRWW